MHQSTQRWLMQQMRWTRVRRKNRHWQQWPVKIQMLKDYVNLNSQTDCIFPFFSAFKNLTLLIYNFTIIYENGKWCRMQSIIHTSEWKPRNSNAVLQLCQELLLTSCSSCHPDELFASSATKINFYFTKALHLIVGFSHL